MYRYSFLKTPDTTWSAFLKNKTEDPLFPAGVKDYKYTQKGYATPKAPTSLLIYSKNTGASGKETPM